MLTLAGQVFSSTLRSTGQARALTELTQNLRAMETSLREDLRHVVPGESVLVIQSNPINAYWTEAGQETDTDGDPSTGYPHTVDYERDDADGNPVPPRADLLLMFSAREAQSTIYPGVRSQAQQVVYSHANLGSYVRDTGGDVNFVPGATAFPVGQNGTPDPMAVSPVPAQNWHLARRSVLLVSAPSSDEDPTWSDSFSSDEVLDGQVDVVSNFIYAMMVLQPAPEPLPGSAFPWYYPPVLVPSSKPLSRSTLDESPPAVYGQRIGSYFMPGCASFKVEWALDPDSEFVAGRLDAETTLHWIDHGLENPLQSLDDAIEDATGTRKADLNSLVNTKQLHPDGQSYSLADRFRDDPEWVQSPLNQGGEPRLAVFTASRKAMSQSGVPELVPDDIFPVALKITVDVFDKNRRLERPTRHVMIIPVGG